MTCKRCDELLQENTVLRGHVKSRDRQLNAAQTRIMQLENEMLRLRQENPIKPTSVSIGHDGRYERPDQC